LDGRTKKSAGGRILGLVRLFRCFQWGRPLVRLVSRERWLAVVTIDKPQFIRYDKQWTDFLYDGENDLARQAKVRPLITASARDEVMWGQ